MANDEVMRFILEAAVEGASSSTSELKQLQQAMDSMAASGELAGKTLDKLSSKLDKRMTSAGTGVTKDLEKQVKLQEELGQAQQKLAKSQDRSAWAGMDKETASRERLKKATEEVASAEERLNAVKKASHGGNSLETEIRATKDLTAANNELSAAQEQQGQSLSTLRYVQYDLAAAYGAVSAALTGLGALTISTFSDMEQGFANVERVMGSDVSDSMFARLEQEILDVARTVPTATDALQDFATRGAQMGIPTEKVAEFTDIMAKFAATSPEVDVNTLAESFGRLSNLTGTDDFEALASAIAKVGINSAATDAEIIKTTQEMSRATNATSLTADEVIGLAAAFASLGVRPEAARGVMNQFFTQLDKGLAGANDSLAVAGQVMGVTADEAARLFSQDAGAFFQKFVAGLSGAENITSVLSEMGLQGQRLLPAFKALAADTERNAAGQSILAQAMRDANQGFEERTELERQYAPMAATLQARTQLMANSMKELAYAVGLEVGPALKGLVDTITLTVQGITNFINTPVGGFLTRIVAVLATAVASYAGLRAVIALATGASVAFTQALSITGRVGIFASLKGLIAGFTGTGTAATGAAAGVSTFRRSLVLLGRATIVVGAIQLIIGALSDIPRTARIAGSAMIWVGDLMVKVTAAIQRFVSSIPLVGGAMANALGPLNRFHKAQSKAGALMKKWGEDNRKAADDVGGASDAAGFLAEAFEDIEGAAGGASDALGGGGGVSDSAKKAQKEIRTLTDYASDLAQVMSRAFEIRFSGANAADQITKTFNELKKATEEAKQRMKDLRLEIRGLQADLGVLSADISTKKYFLSIAIEYGDTKRAAELQADITKLESDRANKQEDLAKKQKELSDAQDSNSKSLKGNTDQAIKNRETIQGLVQSYQAQIEALAKSGMSQDKLKKKVAQLRADFIRQATQLGFNRDELRKYEVGFDDAAVAIANVPRNVTIEADANPALTALKELQAEAQKTADALSGVGSGGVGGGGGGGFDGSGLDFGEMFDEEPFTEAGKDAGQGFFDGFSSFLNPAMWVLKFQQFVNNLRGVLEGSGKSMSDFLWNPLGTAIDVFQDKTKEGFEELPGKSGPAATTSGVSLMSSLFSNLPSTIEKGRQKLSEWFQGLPSSIGSTARNAGASVWRFLTETLPNWLSNAWTGFKTWLQGLPGRATTTAKAAGSKIWNKLTEFGTSFSNALTRVKNWFRNLPTNVWNTVTTAARNVWRQFTSTFGSGSAASRAGALIPGRANGGYAGAGAKYDVKGVYHGGEYVIPKRDVNQATGMPYASALGRLLRGSPGAANGTGPRRGSGPGSMEVALSAGSIQAIAQAVPQYLVLDGRKVGQATSNEYANQNAVGAY